VKIANSKPAEKAGHNLGLGLQNLHRQLELLYPERYELQLVDEPNDYTVRLRLVLS